MNIIDDYTCTYFYYKIHSFYVLKYNKKKKKKGTKRNSEKCPRALLRHSTLWCYFADELCVNMLLCKMKKKKKTKKKKEKTTN